MWATGSRKDRSSLLSYSYDGDVMTIDPVSTANPGWHEFLAAYNQFCSEHGGIPLFNQTLGITRAQVQKGLGDRLETFADGAQNLRPDRPAVERLFPRTVGRIAADKRRIDACHTVGTAQERIRLRSDRIGLRRRHLAPPGWPPRT